MQPRTIITSAFTGLCQINNSFTAGMEDLELRNTPQYGYFRFLTVLCLCRPIVANFRANKDTA